MLKTIYLAAFVISLLFPLGAHASQDAFIRTDRAVVREAPSDGSPALDHLSKGERVRVSNQSKSGFYKTKFGPLQYGWIRATDLEFSPQMERVPEAEKIEEAREVREDRDPREPKKPEVRRLSRRQAFASLKLGGLGSVIFSPELSRTLDQGSAYPYFGGGYFGEIGIRVADRTRVALRYATFASKTTVLYYGTAYRVEHRGRPLLLGVDVDLLMQRRYEISAGLYAGPSLRNQLVVTVPDFPEPNSFKMTAKTVPAFLLNVSSRYILGPYLAVVGEFGLYYSAIDDDVVPNSFSADVPFRRDKENMISIGALHFGPMLTLGMQVRI